MEIVLNKDRRPFCLTAWARQSFDALKIDYTTVDFRKNELFVEMVRNYGNRMCSGPADLSIVEIPDEATDYMFGNFGEGLEEIIYVLDGKIYLA